MKKMMPKPKLARAITSKVFLSSSDLWRAAPVRGATKLVNAKIKPYASLTLSLIALSILSF